MKQATKTIKDVITEVCANNFITKEDHVTAAIEQGKNFFFVHDTGEVLPIFGNGSIKYHTMTAFINDFKKDIPVIEKSSNGNNIEKLDKLAKSGDLKAYRQARKKMRA